MKKRIFLSAPITGQINENKGAFNDAATILRAMGHIVFVPYEIMQMHDCTDFDHMTYCRICGAVLIRDADIMIQLKGWEMSAGCAIEKSACDLFKIDYMTIEEFLEKNNYGVPEIKKLIFKK